jgi:predicted DNA-binding ribbon-helix-helix protein
MRTTVYLDDQLLTEAKKTAAERGTTLTALIEDAVRAALARRRQPKLRSRVRLPVFPNDGRGKGLQPGVDLDDSAALLDVMDR